MLSFISLILVISEWQVMAIAEHHSATFIAIKQPVAAGGNWPTADIRQPEKIPFSIPVIQIYKFSTLPSATADPFQTFNPDSRMAA